MNIILGQAVLIGLSSEQLQTHFKNLTEQDRYDRFNGRLSTEVINRYCDKLAVGDDFLIALMDNDEVVGLAHLGKSDPETVELGLSILKSQQGQGWGSKLFEISIELAMTQNFKNLEVHWVSTNSAMARLVEKQRGLSLLSYQKGCHAKINLKRARVLKQEVSEAQLSERLKPLRKTLDIRPEEAIIEKLA